MNPRASYPLATPFLGTSLYTNSQRYICVRKLLILPLCVGSISSSASGQTPPPTASGGIMPLAAPAKIEPVVAAKRVEGIHWKSLVREWWTFIAMEQVER